MKNIVKTILLLSMVAVLTVSIFAADGIYVYDQGEMTIIFKNTSFDENERLHIVNHLTDLEVESITPRGLICDLFGHDTTSDIVSKITHCASATSPRCLSEDISVITCSRCNYTSSEKITQGYFTCCP